ncbi:Bacteriohemerythrin [Gammaproteobacteria bacterium]
MSKKIFNFEKEFKLGIDIIDNEHVILVDMLNDVYSKIKEGNKSEACKSFNDTLAAYVHEHFANEEKFMEEIGYPDLPGHRKIHENFKKSVEKLKYQIELCDETAFRNALNDTFSWIINHIGKTDRKYALFYLAKKAN